MKTIYLLGNPLIEQDASPLRLQQKLQTAVPQFQFVHLDPTENFPQEEHLILIDTVLDIKKVALFTEGDLDKIKSSPSYSLHDFDLAFQLKLSKKLGTIKKFTILGIPSQGNEKEILNHLKKILSSL